MAYADRLEGEVVGFQFRSPEGAFAVARLRTPDGAEHVVVGPIGHLAEGQRLVAEGQHVLDGRFGAQFKVERYLVEDPRTLRGMERYLAAAMPGVGEELARRIVDHFGLETLRVLQDTPERLREVAGIGAKTLERIQEHWQGDLIGRELMVMLRGFDLGPAVCNRVLKRFGKDALSILQRTPYRLVEVAGVGFRTADTIALANGVHREDPARLTAAVEYSLRAAEDEGHCFLPEGVLLARLVELDIGEEAARAGVDRLVLTGRVFRHAGLSGERPVYRPEMDHLEGEVARRLLARVAAGRVAYAVDVAAAERAVGLELSPSQRVAVDLAWSAGVTVVTGGPGTGKTTIVKVLLAVASARKEKWACAAPTGRAARRLSEVAHTDAKTLHRLLEFNPMEDRFQRDADKPLEVDGVLVDEASMVDIRLFGALLAALPTKCRLVLVGDHDQLPSVGPGRVLGDLIACQVLPVARLTEIYRQAQDSGIIRNAHRVLAGTPPVSGEQEGHQDCYVIERDDAMKLRQLLLQALTERLPARGFDPRVDVQVLTPMHAGPLGTIALNEALQAALNPTGPELRSGKRIFRLHDRVMQTKNNYEQDVYNGDVGRIVEVHPTGLTVDFDGRVITVGLDNLDVLDPAWAISIHKSQGSEYPAVLLVLHHSQYVMLRRNLLYTGLTRAKRFACVFASRRALLTAVERTGGDDRYSGLARRLASGG